jgi:NADPH:quinone reductase-like Zn-dependent oxidoreductase
MNIPETMMAVIQKESGGELFYEETPVPLPGKGEVLVKMEYAPVNPSDLSFLQGSYAEKPSYPAIPGIEGSGTVVMAGKGILPFMRKGKRVACTSTHGKGGSWAEYMVTSAMNVIPVGNDISFEQAATLIVNPLTALSFMDIIKKHKHKAVANNGAGGALGKMLVRLCKNENIKLISIVRSEESAVKLKESGAETVIIQNKDDFEEQLRKHFDNLKPTLIFDAVGGEQTKLLVEYSPAGSTIMPYANLSEQDSVFNPRTLLQQDKIIKGFFLGSHTSQQSLPKVLKNIKTAQKLIGSVLNTNISKIYNAEEANRAIADYSNNQSKGKVLIKPGIKR